MTTVTSTASQSHRLEARPSLKRLLFQTGALVVFVWAGWAIVVNTTASNQRDPSNALVWQPTLTEALVELAEERLLVAATEADLNDIEAIAHSTLLHAPLESRVLRILGLVADIREQSQQSEPLMRLTADRARRDALSQVWLLDLDLRHSEFAGATSRIDVILRARPDLGSMLLPAIAAIAHQPSGVTALADHLASGPPWRHWLLEALPSATDPSVIHALLLALKATSAPPRMEEVRRYVDRLVALELFDLAYLTWVGFLPEKQRSNLPYMYNGAFELAVVEMPFNWLLQPAQGARTEIVDTGEDGNGKALRVTFANTRIRYSHTRKLLILPAGRYAYSGAERALNLVNERGVAWRLRCADGSKESLAESPTMLGTVEWEKFAVEFTVPVGCRAQWLSLELLARIPSEEQVAGEVWYDDLAILRYEGPAS